jgi:hypothetical protein
MSNHSESGCIAPLISLSITLALLGVDIYYWYTAEDRCKEVARVQTQISDETYSLKAHDYSWVSYQTFCMVENSKKELTLWIAP